MLKTKGRLLDEIDDLEKLLKRISKKLPDAEKLRLLADWIDAKYPNDCLPEVQEDLRKWANNIDNILNKIKTSV